MHTKLFWIPKAAERRTRRRSAGGFYAIELMSGGRYLRRVANVSHDGLMLESPLADERPGQVLELELPRRGLEPPMRVKTQVVRVSGGTVGIRRLDSDGPLPVEALGGPEML
jgi:hypothetical protein